MSSLVQQLQQDALDQNVPVADLLRKAKFVATKLAVEEEIEWIESELNGYSNQDETPPYRRMMGVPKALNTTQGCLPIYFTNNDEIISTRHHWK